MIRYLHVAVVGLVYGAAIALMISLTIGAGRPLLRYMLDTALATSVMLLAFICCCDVGTWFLKKDVDSFVDHDR
jgi:hypothetical protein